MVLFKRGQVVEVKIEDYAFGGKGIARFPTEKGNYVVFVDNSLPGQTVKAIIAKAKKRYSQAKLMEVISKSPHETEIPYQRIAGAPFAALPIDKQEELKEQSAMDLYSRVGEIENIEELYEGLISSPNIWHYRNKMEYAFSAIRFDLDKGHDVDEFGLGFKHRGTWWMVENLDGDSGLFDAQFEDGLKVIRKWCEETGLPPWHAPRKEGFFRFITVRKSYTTNELLVMLTTTSDGLDEFDMAGFTELLKELYGDRLAGFLHAINDSTGDRVQPSEGEAELIYGRPKIEEDLLGLEFEISIQSFFQTNPVCAKKLYSQVLEYIDKGGEQDGVIMDLFCGTGTIAQLIARHRPHADVIGVDIVKEAIEDATANAQKNGLQDVKFHAADVGKFLLEYPEYKGRIGTVVLDPPRGGISPKTLRKVMRLEAPVIVYVSCNPATQARDLKTMREWGYRLDRFKLCDQFPHTSHVESIALLVAGKQ